MAAAAVGCSIVDANPAPSTDDTSTLTSEQRTDPPRTRPDATPSPTGSEPSEQAGASGCAFTDIIANYLAHEQSAERLAASPLASTIEAVRSGAPLPPLPEDAAEWVDQHRHLESLTIAAWLSCPPLAEDLLAAGVPVEGLLDAGYSPAMVAAAAAEWDVLEVLLDHGADPLRTAPSEPGAAVLTRASALGEMPVVQRILDEHDLDPTHPALGDALHGAVMANRPRIVALLLDTGMRPPVDALMESAQVVTLPEVFDQLAEAARQADYTGVADDELTASHLETMCDWLARPDAHESFRPDDLDLIAKILGDELPC